MCFCCVYIICVWSAMCMVASAVLRECIMLCKYSACGVYWCSAQCVLRIDVIDLIVYMWLVSGCASPHASCHCSL